MTREQKVSTLIQYLKQENQGYASIPDPIDEGEQRRLLRSLMNVRYPGHASAEYEKLQDELLQEEAEEKGIVTCNDIPVIEQESMKRHTRAQPFPVPHMGRKTYNSLTFRIARLQIFRMGQAYIVIDMVFFPDKPRHVQHFHG